MIKRQITRKIIEGLNHFRIVMLNGPRQSGKSTLVKKVAKSLDMAYITLDDPDHLALAINDPKNFLDFYANKPLLDSDNKCNFLRRSISCYS